MLLDDVQILLLFVLLMNELFELSDVDADEDEANDAEDHGDQEAEDDEVGADIDEIVSVREALACIDELVEVDNNLVLNCGGARRSERLLMHVHVEVIETETGLVDDVIFLGVALGHVLVGDQIDLPRSDFGTAKPHIRPLLHHNI